MFTSLGMFVAVVAGANFTGTWAVGRGESKRPRSPAGTSVAAGSAKVAGPASGFPRQREERDGTPRDRCDWPGTECEEGTCRLASGSRWRFEKARPRDRIVASERLFDGGLVLPLGEEFLRLVVRVEAAE